MALFLAASLLATVSWNVQWLIAARVLQGAAAGILQPLAMIVLFRVFPVEERGRAMALYGFGIVLAPAIGPAIGGVLLEAFGWRSIFLLTVPFCIAGLALGPRALPRHAQRTSRRFDWTGWALLLGALITLLNVPVRRPSSRASHRRRRSGSPRAASRWRPGSSAGRGTPMRRYCRSACFGTGPSRGPRSSPSPMASGFSERRISFPSSHRRSRITTLREAGYLLLPPGIALAFAIAIGGRLTDRMQPAPIIVAGLALFAASSLLLAFSGSQHRVRRCWRSG